MLAMNLDRTILCGAIGMLFLRPNRPTSVATLFSYFKSRCYDGRGLCDRSRNRRSIGRQVLTSCETIHGTLTSSCQHVRHFGRTAMETHKPVHHDNVAPCRHAAAHLGRAGQKASPDDGKLAGGGAADARDTRLKPAAAVSSQKDRGTPRPRPLRSMEGPVGHGVNRRNRRTGLPYDSSPHEPQIVSQSLPHLVDHKMSPAPPLEVLYRDQHFA